jgi:Cu/Ag efflux protein CusF
MSKLSTLILAAFAAVAFNAQAASHAGGAPMKASEPMAKASGAKKEVKKEEKKAEAKKEEPKK